MVKYCFVILHYQGIEDTRKCIESIKKLDECEECRVVVIDNNSPNKSGDVLRSEYEFDEQVDIILNPINDGFSRANNKACEYAHRKYSPNFYIVINNDIVIHDKQFLHKIDVEYSKSNFDVLGPDIYNPIQKVHQSPLRKKAPGVAEITKTILMNRVLLFMLRNSISGKVVCKYFKKLEDVQKDSESYEKRQDSVCLMGAVMIFSSQFYEEKGAVFSPETDFYYEEFILYRYCIRKSANIIYTPDIYVEHNSGSATQKTYSQYRDRCKFIIENTIKGASIYRKYILDIGKNKNG